MKELLSIEEKAKLYDEAVERANSLLIGDQSGDAWIYRLFPELQESEDDRIRKEIIQFLQLPHPQFVGKRNHEEWIAWLEKQGERDEECKEINLVETLKHYPRETELYSPLYGKLWLAEVDEEHEIITCYRYPLDEGCTRAILEQEDTVSFYSDGTTGLPDYTVSKDCMLFLYNKQDKQKSVCSKENSCYYDDICEILINLINSPKSKVNKDVVQKDLDRLMSVWESLKSPLG